MIDHANLKALATAATKGEWTAFVAPGTYAVRCPGKVDIVLWPGFDDSDRPQAEHAANARYIAAASPDTVLDLLAEREELRAMLRLMGVSVEALDALNPGANHVTQ